MGETLLWMSGIVRLDNILIYEYMGIGAIFLAACILFFAEKSRKYTYLKIIIFVPIFGATVFTLFIVYMGYAYTDEELEAIIIGYTCLLGGGCGY